jgi:hypothetical protein
VTIDEIHQLTNPHEKTHFIWRANAKRHDFFDNLYKLRKNLGWKLAEQRSGLVGDLDEEWQALLEALAASRALLAEESATLTQQLWDGANDFRIDLDQYITETQDWLDERIQ